jgi:chromosome segregation ATPase
MSPFTTRRNPELSIIRRTVLREADKLHAQWPDVYEEIGHSDPSDVPELVNALIRELKKSLNKTSHLAGDVKQLEQVISELRAGGDSTTREHQREISNLKEAHANEIQGYVSRVSQLESDVSRLQYEKHVIEDGKHALENEVSTLKRNNEGQRKEMERAHDLELSSLKDRLRKEHDTEKEGLRSGISELQTDLESEIKRWQQKLDSTIGQIRQQHGSEIECLVAKISEMKQEHKSEKDRTSREYESDRARLVAKMVEMKQEHDSEQEQMRKDVEARKLQLERQKSEEEARLKSEFETKKMQLVVAHTVEKKRLRRDIEAYSGALLARDDFKLMSDNQVEARFLDLAQEVDDLARLEWKPNQKDWTDQVLLRLARNQRLLRKQILQDSVWVILHEYIFCSPFRILGEEGRSLESQWSDEYGKG